MSAKFLNDNIDLLFQYWDGKITEKQLKQSESYIPISEEVDEEIQKDSFY